MNPSFLPLVPLQASGTGNTDLVDGLVLVAFVAFGLFCWWRRISYRISVLVGLVFLVVAAIAVAIGREDAANFVAILAYYSLVVGVGLAIVEYVRETKAAERLSIVKADRTVVHQGRAPSLRERLSARLRLFRRNRE